MTRSIAGIFVFLLTLADLLHAQGHDQAGPPSIRDTAHVSRADTTSLALAFKRGQFKGLVRYFFMATDNKTGLTDYYASALGGGFRYETGSFHGFQVAAGLYSTFNLGSSDMTARDPVTGQYNRYEIALFDLEDPARKKDITRLEEAYLKYNFKGSKLILGRQLINTPFINLQDGRIRPTAVEGLWMEWNEFKGLKIEGGWIYAVSPRGTIKWHKAGRSIGLYPVGLNVNGTKSQYYQALQSDGIAMAGITKKVNNVKLQVWDVFTENVFNTAMAQADVQLLLKEISMAFVSAQFIRQDAINNGGNEDPDKTYFQKGAAAMTFGASAGWKNRQWEAAINYNRITTHGRYLMPREWGRDPFFTFMPRERNEGFGDVHAFMAKVNYTIPRSKMKTSLAGGYFKLPDINDFRLNKYVVPSYTQVNFDTRYPFGRMLKGLDAQLLVAAKFAGSKGLHDNAVFNKVDMLQYNFVLNYHF